MKYGPKDGKYGLKITDSKGRVSTNWYASEDSRDKEFNKQERLMKKSWSSGIKKVEKTSR